MSDFSRRDFIGTAATAGLLGAVAAGDEDFPFKDNVPDPLLAAQSPAEPARTKHSSQATRRNTVRTIAPRA
jgi:hypothetical protein